jgi:ketosteroid isomerase-like protein
MTTIQRAPIDTARSVLDAIDKGELEAVIDMVIADDVHFHFGNFEPTSTRAGFLATVQAVGASIAGIRHEVVDVWEPEAGAVVVTSDVHYRRVDGQELTLPACSVFRVREGLVHDYRVYMDINPVLAP